VQQFVGMHGETMEKRDGIGKREASIYKLTGKL
jgi:hypothetical protein